MRGRAKRESMRAPCEPCTGIFEERLDMCAARELFGVWDEVCRAGNVRHHRVDLPIGGGHGLWWGACQDGRSPQQMVTGAPNA